MNALIELVVIWYNSDNHWQWRVSHVSWK